MLLSRLWVSRQRFCGLQHTQEVVAWKECLAFAVRPSAGEWLHLRICVSTLNPEELSVSQYLEFKERLVGEIIKTCTFTCSPHLFLCKFVLLIKALLYFHLVCKLLEVPTIHHVACNEYKELSDSSQGKCRACEAYQGEHHNLGGGYGALCALLSPYVKTKQYWRGCEIPEQVYSFYSVY